MLGECLRSLKTRAELQGIKVRVFHVTLFPFFGGEPLISAHSPEEIIAGVSTLSKRAELNPYSDRGPPCPFSHAQ